MVNSKKETEKNENILKSLYGSVVILLFSVQLGSCGQVKPSGSGNSDGQDDDNQVFQEVDFTWSVKPTDVLVIQENSNRLAQRPLSNMLYLDDRATPLGYQNLAIRLYNSGVDFQLAATNAAQSSADAWGKLKVVDDQAVLTPSSFDFIQDSVALLNHTDIKTVSNQYQPLRSLLATIQSSEPNNKKFLRSDTNLAILSISYQDETSESLDVADITEELNTLKGIGNWTVWNLGTPEGGCSFENQNSVRIYPNADPSAANIVDPQAEGALASINKYKRRNKWLKLAEYSEGKTASICSSSYSDFLGDFANEAVRPSLSPITLEKVPNSKTIEVRVKGTLVNGWQYEEGTTVLYLPTSIPSETKVQVSYHIASSGVIVQGGEDGPKDILSKIGGSKISPNELLWLTEVAGISPKDAFSANCRGCHGQYARFNGFVADLAKITALTNNADKTVSGGGMPRGGAADFASSSAGQAILNYVAQFEP